MQKFCFFAIGVLFFLSCSRYILPVKESKRKKILDQSGFITDTDSILRTTNEELTAYQIRDGERVADIGFSTGWLEGLMVLKYDSLKIYGVELSNEYLRNLKVVTEAYSGLRKIKGSSDVIGIKGKKGYTNLAGGFFDKVIVRETFHHFSDKNKMLKDVFRILKPTGRLIIHEPFTDSSFYSVQCKERIFSPIEVERVAKENKFSLESKYILFRQPGNVPSWHKTEIIKGIILIFKKE